MRDGALNPWHVEEVLLGLFDTLGDRRRDLLGLAVADADVSVAVTHHDECCEGEPATTLDDLGDPVDRDDALDVVALLRGRATTIITAATLPSGTTTAALGSRHSLLPL